MFFSVKQALTLVLAHPAFISLLLFQHFSVREIIEDMDVLIFMTWFQS